MAFPKPPLLDAHAHIATDVTATQVRGLEGAIVFAMTRSLSEAASVPHGCYSNILWGIGVHPRDNEALGRYDGDRFSAMLHKFALVGEVGIDRRAGNINRQKEVFSDILARIEGRPSIVSIHSTAAVSDVIETLRKYPPRVPILHWFGGSAEQAREAAELGAWFSVNAAMKDDVISVLPRKRILTETDFPYTRRFGAARPGSTDSIIEKLAHIRNSSGEEIRADVWNNLLELLEKSDVTTQLPNDLRAHLGPQTMM